jgi:hypothetical protein
MRETGITAMDKYALIFEGPTNEDADTLRKLKGAFLGELNFSVEETINAFQNCPVKVKESEDQAELSNLLVTLIAAGGRARIDEPISKLVTPPKSAQPAAPAPDPHAEFSFELEGERTSAPPPVTPAKESEQPALSTAQSTLLSLEGDPSPFDSTSAAPQAAPAIEPVQQKLEKGAPYSLELCDIEPHMHAAPEPKREPEPELEIHFETETKEQANPIEKPVQAVSLPAVSAQPLTTEDPQPRAPPPQTPHQLIPAFNPPPPVQAAAAVAAPSVTQVEPSPNAPFSPTRPKSRSRIQPFLIEYGPSILAPLVILIVGNIAFFSLWSKPETTPPGVAAKVREQAESVAAPAADEPKKEVVPPGSFSGASIAGDFRVDWRILTQGEELVSVQLKITPPTPPELEARDIVAGKKPPLKVTAIEIDDLPLTKVGKFAASVSGPARISMVDDGRALRAVGAAQFSVEFHPETRKVSGELKVKTDAAQDSPLRWIAERSADLRPMIKLQLAF